MSEPPDKGKDGQGRKSQDSLKPIIKVSEPAEEPRKSNESDRKPSTEYGLKVPGSHPNLKKSSGAGDLTRNRGVSIGSIHSTASTLFGLRSKKHDPAQKQVRFLENVAWRSISAITIPKSNSLTSFPDIFESQTNLDDANELPGFANLFFAQEITISESCCGGNVYTICENKDGNTLYHAVKKVDGSCASICKCLCPCNLNYTRVGFSICLYCITVGTKLVSFTRTMHWLANQLDIVETFYTVEKCYLGRIEKSSEGYCVIDRRGCEIYEVTRAEKSKRTLYSVERTLIVKSKNGMLSDAIIQYSKGTCFSNLLCCVQFKHTISWMYENIDVVSKILLVGVLLLELNSDEEFVDLPLGSDAIRVGQRF